MNAVKPRRSQNTTVTSRRWLSSRPPRPSDEAISCATCGAEEALKPADGARSPPSCVSDPLLGGDLVPVARAGRSAPAAWPACWLRRRVRRGEFAAVLVHLGEQPRVAHRQHRLVGEDVFIGPIRLAENSPALLPQHHRRAQDAILVLPAAPPARRMMARLDGDIAQPILRDRIADIGNRRSARLWRRHRRAASCPASIARDGWPSAALVDADRFREGGTGDAARRHGP